MTSQTFVISPVLAMKDRIFTEDSASAQKLRKFEQKMITSIINEACHDTVNDDQVDLDPLECNTMVKYMLIQTCGDGEKIVGSDIVNLPLKFPQLRIASIPSLASFINRRHDMFKRHRDLLEKLFEHDDFARELSFDEETDATIVEQYVPNEMMRAMTFSCKRTVNQKIGRWSITSKIGTCQFSARQLIRSIRTEELDWSVQAAAIRAISACMASCGVACVRQCVELQASCGSFFRLEIMFSPRAPSPSHAMATSTVRMREAEETESSSSKLQAVNRSVIKTEGGCSRYDVVRSGASSLYTCAKKISTVHVENQVMREILRMRENQSEESGRLTMQHKGRYLKSETLLHTLNEELRIELTPLELREAECWIEACLSKHELKLSCFRAKMQSDYLQDVAQLSTVSADMVFTLHCAMPCITPAFHGREISLQLQNFWKLNLHTMIVLS
ncbi:hypothetical protein GUITHDRAFT_132892 [Guillardia theta CCMP2712]|uniref:Uncharacterized protein n=1 Tax=Guillardia theta (strain CCMP2712) TaxID=905079 RepID=L1JZS9_GUITC|nr:hypothetical protein GUITHDRAFT_132892 [Guillardia theta CCMP2712]EKX53857.1 hypothetical protein GUITHDRAFT_132892 [Guillardia theta CCMP2712]|mmetsp:Transcript_7604/g.25844  ORF Transcript_7604/g.25844 Transcript_7604/m.25844 type:complete len:446 (-) Transcript_7604:179-1516(-)|eukprot:XP_005840837.1 hypothetical protein GUITHDRAFT_132892 [Guillardia theta CCMP2712]